MQTNISSQAHAAHASPRALAKITEIGLARAPEEALGLILPTDHVIELPNRAATHKLRCDRAETTEEDVNQALERWLLTDGRWFLEAMGTHVQSNTQSIPVPSFDLINWHTHPKDTVGPSKRDMEWRRSLSPDEVENGRFLVVAIPSGAASFY